MTTRWDIVTWMWEHPWSIALNAAIWFGATVWLYFSGKRRFIRKNGR
jgi:hypothetical protein